MASPELLCGETSIYTSIFVLSRELTRASLPGTRRQDKKYRNSFYSLISRLPRAKEAIL